jgi:hypothetical protein
VKAHVEYHTIAGIDPGLADEQAFGVFALLLENGHGRAFST